jgi:hypothetical protein
MLREEKHQELGKTTNHARRLSCHRCTYEGSGATFSSNHKLANTTQTEGDMLKRKTSY